MASGHGLTAVVRLLLDKGADANKPDHKGDTPLGIAATTNQCDMILLLLTYAKESIDFADVILSQIPQEATLPKRR